MATEILIQVFYGVSIVAVIVLIAVLWRTFEILGDTKEASSLLLKRVKEIDELVGKAKDSMTNISETIKAFVYSLGIVKTVRNAINESNKNKGESNGEG